VVRIHSPRPEIRTSNLSKLAEQVMYDCPQNLNSCQDREAPQAALRAQYCAHPLHRSVVRGCECSGSRVA